MLESYTPLGLMAVSFGVVTCAITGDAVGVVFSVAAFAGILLWKVM